MNTFSHILARSGEEGIRLAEENSPDVALVDIRLPGLGGLEVLRRLRDASAGTEVVMMTAHATVASAVEALKLGAKDYLEKPFSLDRAVATVRDALIARINQDPRVEAFAASAFTRIRLRAPSIKGSKNAFEVAEDHEVTFYLAEPGRAAEAGLGLVPPREARVDVPHRQSLVRRRRALRDAGPDVATVEGQLLFERGAGQLHPRRLTARASRGGRPRPRSRSRPRCRRRWRTPAPSGCPRRAAPPACPCW